MKKPIFLVILALCATRAHADDARPIQTAACVNHVIQILADWEDANGRMSYIGTLGGEQRAMNYFARECAASPVWYFRDPILSLAIRANGSDRERVCTPDGNGNFYCR